ncbi:hypothetical protein PR048_018054 [Dryococelus australis]|uniref:Uncharacterized protein n=1 Tax=Dryococelus australis TaxID=614101 RepID=A0ABQ9HBC6_9NEOP|nr:hypothetical protein PR048_018054 [Dryococelus australis]
MKGLGETGDPRENPPISGIINNDSHMQKSLSDPSGNRTRPCQDIFRLGNLMSHTQHNNRVVRSDNVTGYSNVSSGSDGTPRRPGRTVTMSQACKPHDRSRPHVSAALLSSANESDIAPRSPWLARFFIAVLSCRSPADDARQRHDRDKAANSWLTSHVPSGTIDVHPWPSSVVLRCDVLGKGRLLRKLQQHTCQGGTAVRESVCHQGDQGSIPGGVTPGYSRVGIVLSDDAGRRVFSRISRFPRPCIPALLHAYLTSPSSALRTSTLTIGKTSSLHLYPHMSGKWHHLLKRMFMLHVAPPFANQRPVSYLPTSSPANSEPFARHSSSGASCSQSENGYATSKAPPRRFTSMYLLCDGELKAGEKEPLYQPVFYGVSECRSTSEPAGSSPAPKSRPYLGTACRPPRDATIKPSPRLIRPINRPSRRHRPSCQPGFLEGRANEGKQEENLQCQRDDTDLAVECTPTAEGSLPCLLQCRTALIRDTWCSMVNSNDTCEPTFVRRRGRGGVVVRLLAINLGGAENATAARCRAKNIRPCFTNWAFAKARRTEETGDSRENPLTRGIVRHDPQMRKFGSNSAGSYSFVKLQESFVTDIKKCLYQLIRIHELKQNGGISTTALQADYECRSFLLVAFSAMSIFVCMSPLGDFKEFNNFASGERATR